MLTCRDVTKAIAQDEWRTASWRRRVALRLHLLRCPHCRRYAAQIRAIGTAVRRLVRGQAQDAGTLQRLEASILPGPEGSADSGESEK
jgi:anti-sigma factor RsiW